MSIGAETPTGSSAGSVLIGSKSVTTLKPTNVKTADGTTPSGGAFLFL